MTDSLTDRYIDEAVRPVPAKQRGELAAELRDSILDQIDTAVEAGSTPEQAEHEVLNALGDPERLAAHYTGRPLYLIGPRLYLNYWRLLKTLLLIIVPLTTAIVVVMDVIEAEQPALGSVIVAAIGAGFQTALQVFFWVTLTFALIDRFDAGEAERLGTWTVEKLPERSDRRITLGDTIGSTVVIVITISLLVLQMRGTFVRTETGERLALLDPDLQSFWLPYLIAVLLVTFGLEVVKYRVGAWNLPLAGANLVVNLAFAAPMIGLAASGRLFNPEAFAALGWPEGAETASAPTVIAILTIGAIAAWDSIDGFAKAIRTPARRHDEGLVAR